MQSGAKCVDVAAAAKEAIYMMNEFAPNVWTVDGPVVDFYGFPYPTRMVVIRLNSGCSWVWSPVQINDALAAEVEAKAGPVK